MEALFTQRESCFFTVLADDFDCLGWVVFGAAWLLCTLLRECGVCTNCGVPDKAFLSFEDRELYFFGSAKAAGDDCNS